MRKLSARTLSASAGLGLLALAGCDQMDPLTRSYAWKPTDVNKQNIAAMAVNPGDLTLGRSQTKRRIVMESDAVERTWTNKPTPLLNGTSSSGGSAAPPGGT